MNHWACMLADLPALGQRLIARRQRVSLPRGCTGEQRLQRLRRALCRATAVRAVFATLDDDARNALRELATRRGGVTQAEMTERYGAVRSWRALADDPHPRNLAEQLLLLGWLLPRPATPRHPAHFLLPAELRRALPVPLLVSSLGAAESAPSMPLAIRATVVLLDQAAQAPVEIRADGTPTLAATRLLAARLEPISSSEAHDLLRFVAPLLQDMGLLVAHNRQLFATPPAARFRALPTFEQAERLRAAWVNHASPDRWLAAWVRDRRGIDWPLFRRKLIHWAEALPPDQHLVAADLYPRLAAALGPLADAHTHGFRSVDRVPWQRARAAAIWQVALRYPLHWLGLVAWQTCDGVETVTRHTSLAIPPVENRDAAVPEQSVKNEGCPASVRPGVERLNNTVRIVQRATLIADSPAQLQRALRSRSVRRYVGPRLAPGIALVEPEHVAPLARALARLDMPAELEPAPATAPVGLTPADCAALLAACANPPTAQLPKQLERQLLAALPPALRAALNQPAAVPPTAAPLSRMPPADIRRELRAAIQRAHMVEITYQTGAGGAWSQRIVRPLTLDPGSDGEYLTAFCTSRRAERVFRLDRVARCLPSASNHNVARLDRHAPDAHDLDSLDARRIDQVAADAVGVWVDQIPQLALEFGK